MQLTGEDHGGTLRGFASFYMEDQKWTARSGTLGHADEKISTALAPRRADDTGNSWRVPRWHDRGGLPVCGVSRPADGANGF